MESAMKSTLSVQHQLCRLIGVTLGIACLAGAAHAGGGTEQYNWLQKLEGDWVLSSNQIGEAAKHPVIAPLVGAGKVALSYRMVGSKTTLQENIFPGTPREMATMYHCFDKECTEVVADHYCSLKNQPVLRATPQPAAGKLVFTCDPSAAVCSSPDPHLHVMTIEAPSGASGQIRTTLSIHRDGKPAEDLVFLFERK
jgi:hypothetical protein